MGEPIKMLSVIMPYKTFEQLQTVAKRDEISVGRVVRNAVDSYLKSNGSRGINK